MKSKEHTTVMPVVQLREVIEMIVLTEKQVVVLPQVWN
jgi:hypothetical protein